jgi:hypothetical protein
MVYLSWSSAKNDFFSISGVDASKNIAVKLVKVLGAMNDGFLIIRVSDLIHQTFKEFDVL